MHHLQAHTFSDPDETRPFVDKGKAEMIDLDGTMVGCGTFEPGWRWSEHVKPIAGTDSCQISHIGYIVSGRMKIHMDNQEEFEVGPGDIARIPPGHDAWTLGDEPCKMVDFGEIDTYAKR